MNLPASAEDVDLIHGQTTKIPHAVKQLSPHTTTREKPTTKNQHSQTNKKKERNQWQNESVIQIVQSRV